jgi:uncharacterized membrane protein
MLSVVLSFLVLSYTSALKERSNLECERICGSEHDVPCPHLNFFPVQSYIGYSLSLTLFILGLFLLFYKHDTTIMKSKKHRNIKALDKEEKRIYDEIADSDGTIFQSELAERTGFSKVKITRVLDRLEGKGLIERRRRGMTNVVILK